MLKDTLNKIQNKFCSTNFISKESVLNFPFIVPCFTEGSLIELSGKKGKKTLALLIAKAVDEQNGGAAIIDADFTLTGQEIKYFGLSEDVLCIHPFYIEDKIVDIIAELSKNVKLIVLDPISVIEYETIDKNIEKIVSIVKQNKVCLLYTNNSITDIRNRRLTTYGGRRLKIYTDLRLKINDFKTKNNMLSFEVEILKNKLSFETGIKTLEMRR